MTTHSSILSLEIPWTEEPPRLQLMCSQKELDGTQQLNKNNMSRLSSQGMLKTTLLLNVEKTSLRIIPKQGKIKREYVFTRTSGEHSHIVVPRASNFLGNMREVKSTTCLCLPFLLSPPSLFSHPAAFSLCSFSMRCICHFC